jgi:hypothetical protein
MVKCEPSGGLQPVTGIVTAGDSFKCFKKWKEVENPAGSHDWAGQRKDGEQTTL